MRQFDRVGGWALVGITRVELLWRARKSPAADKRTQKDFFASSKVVVPERTATPLNCGNESPAPSFSSTPFRLRSRFQAGEPTICTESLTSVGD